jgi:hypothetical protein
LVRDGERLGGSVDEEVTAGLGFPGFAREMVVGDL